MKTPAEGENCEIDQFFRNLLKINQGDAGYQLDYWAGHYLALMEAVDAADLRNDWFERHLIPEVGNIALGVKHNPRFALPWDSQGSYRHPEQTKKEFDRLRTICAQENIQQSQWGGRQHYLRFKNPETFRNWANAGLAYDSTLGYADRIGFRCGTCYEYPVFDLRQRKTLPLRERPLVVMEGTLLWPIYMGIEPGREALKRLVELKETCRKYNGDFVLLWHNSELDTPEKRQLYLDILAA